MKKFILLSVLTILLMTYGGYSQDAIIIDHNCIDLEQVPDNYVIQAKEKFVMAYGHTSHGNQEHKDVPVGNSPSSLGYIKAMYSYDNIIFGLTGNFVDEMFSNWSIVNEKRVADAVPAYFNLALNCRIKDIFKSGVMLNFHASNLLDQEILYTSNSQEYSQRGYLFAGRTYYFTLGYGF